MFLLAVLLATGCLIVGQDSREEGVRQIQSKLFDAPSAAYKLTAARNGRGYQFCNTSAARVVSFRLGCVERKRTALKILSERSSQAGDLAPLNGDTVDCRAWDCNDCFFPGEACKKGKLAVIEVALADGTVWTLK